MGFYGSNDPTSSVKALKEDRSQGLGFNSDQVHSTTLTIVSVSLYCIILYYYTTNMHYETKTHKIHKDKHN